jgi:hypothetical protein
VLEAIDAGFAHDPSTDQQLQKGSAGLEQSGSGDHRGDDDLPAAAIEVPLFGFEFALLGGVLGGFRNRAIDPRDLLIRSCVLSSIVVIQVVSAEWRLRAGSQTFPPLTRKGRFDPLATFGAAYKNPGSCNPHFLDCAINAAVLR